MSEPRSRRIGGVIAGILFFVIVGFPLLAYLWETLNEVLSARVSGRRLMISIPLLVLFILLLGWLARTVQRWSGERTTSNEATPR